MRRNAGFLHLSAKRQAVAALKEKFSRSWETVASENSRRKDARQNSKKRDERD
jgi:hypothetical protein